MCGIVGEITYSDQCISDKWVRDSSKLMAHRGPDGEGFYNNQNVAFGHCRGMAELAAITGEAIEVASIFGRQSINKGGLPQYFEAVSFADGADAAEQSVDKQKPVFRYDGQIMRVDIAGVITDLRHK